MFKLSCSVKVTGWRSSLRARSRAGRRSSGASLRPAGALSPCHGRCLRFVACVALRDPRTTESHSPMLTATAAGRRGHREGCPAVNPVGLALGAASGLVSLPAAGSRPLHRGRAALATRLRGARRGPARRGHARLVTGTHEVIRPEGTDHQHH